MTKVAPRRSGRSPTRRARWRRRLAATVERGRSVRPGRAAAGGGARAGVRARAESRGAKDDAGYGLETELAEPDPALIDAAGPAAAALDALLRPMVALGRRLEAVLGDPPDWMDGAARARVEGAIASLGWRAETVGGMAEPAGADRRAGRSRFRRLAGGRARRGARIRHRPASPLARPDPAVRGNRAETRARRAGDERDADRCGRAAGRWLGNGGGARGRAAPAAPGRALPGREPVRLSDAGRGDRRHRHSRAATFRRWPTPMPG